MSLHPTSLLRVVSVRLTIHFMVCTYVFALVWVVFMFSLLLYIRIDNCRLCVFNRALYSATILDGEPVRQTGFCLLDGFFVSSIYYVFSILRLFWLQVVN